MVYIVTDDGKRGWEGDEVPWEQCATVLDCIEEARKKGGTTKYVVSYDVMGKYSLIHNNSLLGT